MPTNFINEIENHRKEKDLFFKNHNQSPLPIKERQKFNGLLYFPVDQNLRFITLLKEHEQKTTVHVEDSKGSKQTFLRWGEFTFPMNNSTYKLQAYKNHPSDTNLWVPFRDKTNNTETYAAGRYIDLTKESDTIYHKWILDFNLAYNPFCAYNENYVCPFIPPENWLKIPIRAGEKTYKK